MTPCGKPFEHAWHLFRTERNKIKACDGTLREKKVGK